MPKLKANWSVFTEGGKFEMKIWQIFRPPNAKLFNQMRASPPLGSNSSPVCTISEYSFDEPEDRNKHVNDN